MVDVSYSVNQIQNENIFCNERSSTSDLVHVIKIGRIVTNSRPHGQILCPTI